MQDVNKIGESQKHNIETLKDPSSTLYAKLSAADELLNAFQEDVSIQIAVLNSWLPNKAVPFRGDLIGWVWEQLMSVSDDNSFSEPGWILHHLIAHADFVKDIAERLEEKALVLTLVGATSGEPGVEMTPIGRLHGKEILFYRSHREALSMQARNFLSQVSGMKEILPESVARKPKTMLERIFDKDKYIVRSKWGWGIRSLTVREWLSLVKHGAQ